MGLKTRKGNQGTLKGKPGIYLQKTGLETSQEKERQVLSPRRDVFLALPGISLGVSGQHLMPVKYRPSILNESNQLLQL